MLSWIGKIFFSMSHHPPYISLPHWLNIYKLFWKWPRYPILKIIIANSCTQLSVCLYHMMLVVSFLYFQWNTRAHARWTRKSISMLFLHFLSLSTGIFFRLSFLYNSYLLPSFLSLSICANFFCLLPSALRLSTAFTFSFQLNYAFLQPFLSLSKLA